jgi:Bacterial regulatory proteins, tetR family
LIVGELLQSRKLHVAALQLPLVVLLEQQGAGQTCDGRLVGEDADDVGAALDLGGALRRMGFTNDEMTAHGFRAMARTLMDEVLHVPPHLIEHQLAHAVRDPNGRAYNRTTHLHERRRMMQQWADYLETQKRSESLASSQVSNPRLGAPLECSPTMARESHKQKLLTEGLRLVHERGYGGASVRDIVAAASVPQGSFTNHFASKEAFGLEVLDLYYARQQDVVMKTLRNDELPPRKWKRCLSWVSRRPVPR